MRIGSYIKTSLVDKLEASAKLIQEICTTAGAAGLSAGILHEKKIIYQSHYGVRSVAAQVAPNNETIYHLGSLTKALTAAGIGTLVDEGKLAWDSRLIDVVPNFSQRNKYVESEATITDLLAHHMGLAMRMDYWAQMEQELLVSSDQAVDVLGALNRTADFRTTIKYNNWTYLVAGQIIERLSGSSLEGFMRTRFFESLGLHRKTFGKVDDANYATAHTTLSNGEPFGIECPRITSGTVMAGAAGLKSSLGDLLQICSL